jgi:hypothetical protein
MCRIVHDIRTCLIWHTKGPGKCVGLYRISEYSGFHLVNRYTLGSYIFVRYYRMWENSGVGLHKFHCNFLPWNIYIVLIVGSHLNDYLKLNFSYIVVFLCFSFDWALFSLSNRCRHGRDRIIVGFTTTYAISAFHHWCCEFESRSGRGVQHYVIMFVRFLRQVGGFLRVHRFPQPIKLTATI